MEELPGIRQLLRLPKVDSTQAVGRKLAEDGAPEWTLVWADRQTQGKGRLGRRWRSSAGGLYVSLVLRPHIAPKRLAELSLATADAVARAVNELSGLKTSVKPPNDVLAQARSERPAKSPGSQDGAYKKVCGILVDASGGSSHVDWVVLGIGLNVNNPTPKTLPAAASLLELSGQELDIESVLRGILETFLRKYKAFLSSANGHIDRPVKA